LMSESIPLDSWLLTSVEKSNQRDTKGSGEVDEQGGQQGNVEFVVPGD
jgi:hypothetical protein